MLNFEMVTRHEPKKTYASNDPKRRRRDNFKKDLGRQLDLFENKDAPKKREVPWVVQAPDQSFHITPRYNRRILKGLGNQAIHAADHQEVRNVFAQLLVLNENGKLDDILEKTAKTPRKKKEGN